MSRQWPDEAGGGKGRCVGSLWITSRPLNAIGHIRVTIGYLKATVDCSSHYIMVTIGHLTLGYL